MNAVLSERGSREKLHMPADEAGAQIGELRADVRHLQSDVTDIKAELRVTNQRIDALSQRVDSLKEALSAAKVWAIGLYVAQSGTLLLVMAHGFKWI